jgi:phosphoribosylformimino-5-aminoimidazole carboxamide ribotide isomerase
MKFRPCIDIHDGKVKQIVGGSLTDSHALENFISEYDAAHYAKMYKNDGLIGGHIAMLNPSNSPSGQKNIAEAVKALNAFPQGLQIGGGITDNNAEFFLQNGASHVIVTSFAFQSGQINFPNIEKLCTKITKNRLVLDLSVRLKDGEYYIVTDRWQVFSREKLSIPLLKTLSAYCDEFLIHAVDVEGKQGGTDPNLVAILADWTHSKITYAGGISTMDDIRFLGEKSGNRLDFTVGSGLDIFGGKIKYAELIRF